MKLRIAIDVTAATTDGGMGGRLTAVVYLTQALLNRWRDLDILLLTAAANHEFFATLAGRNRLVCLVGEAPPLPSPGLREQLRTWLPGGGPRAPLSPQTLQADLLFRPFGGDSTELPAALRQLPWLGQFVGAADDAAQSRLIVAPSRFARQQLVEQYGIAADRIKVIPLSVPQPLLHAQAEQEKELVTGLGLKGKKYIYYPANFWPYKNHDILLVAFNQLVRAGYDWQLVFTGALTDSRPLLRAAVQQMGLQQRVYFLGYVTEAQKAAIMKECHCLVLPSLYEEFGLPILEAMAFRRPILCSNSTSLPEVAGDAALYFDPRKPAQLVAALQRLAEEPNLYQRLQEKGNRRLQDFAPQQMADAYIRLFQQGSRQLA